MTKTELRNGSTAADPRLGLLNQTDPRNNDYRVERGTAYKVAWEVDRVLDQGVNGACVGYALVHCLRAQGWQLHAMNETFAWNLYTSAQKIDPWHGGEYDDADPVMAGTSLLAASKVLHRHGYITRYEWANTPTQVKSGLTSGPGVLGCEWRTVMDLVDSSGVVEVSGERVGGHAVAITGFDGDNFTITNSWGDGWGNRGHAVISSANLKKLLRDKVGKVVFPRSIQVT